MLPTILPDLPKPSRTSGESQKPVLQNSNLYIEIKENSVNLFIDPFEGPYQWGEQFLPSTVTPPVNKVALFSPMWPCRGPYICLLFLQEGSNVCLVVTRHHAVRLRRYYTKNIKQEIIKQEIRVSTSKFLIVFSQLLLLIRGFSLVFRRFVLDSPAKI